MSASLNVDGGTGKQGYLDTLAQSFFVDRPIHATKLDIFFSAKEGTLPVEVSLRKIENNLPSPNVIAGSSVVIDAADIVTSANSYSSTTFTFPVPVLLDSGQYCFALSSDSKKNQVYVASMGADDLLTESVISKQPYSGVMYMSSNGVTWEADQTRDIKFKLYRANVTSTSATVDLILQRNNFSFPNITVLDANPFKSFTSSDVIRVYHVNHGFPTGAYVKFDGIKGNFTHLANANAYVTLNGIPYDFLNNTYLTVSNVTNNGYTVVLGTNAATTANITPGNFGGYGVLASTMLPYSTLFPSISAQSPAKTSVTHSVKTTDTSYAVSSLTTINPDQIDFGDVKLIVDNKNRTTSMAGAESFGYRLTLSTTDSYVSPVINLPMSSMLFVAPDINSPTSADNLSVDLVNIVSANVGISFASSGVVTIANAGVQANVKTMRAGAYVTIAGAGDPTNNGTFRLVAVANDGSTFRIPSANVEGTGNAITLTYRPNFIDEKAASASSSRAKYVTRKIELATPATGMLVRFAVSKPVNTDIEVYYKTLDGTEIGTFEEKEYTQLSLGTITTTIKDQFVDVEKFVENLTAFSAIVVKIVLKSTTIANYPEVKDLRIIALA